MYFNKAFNFRNGRFGPVQSGAWGKRSLGRRWRQISLLVLMLVLGACSSNSLAGLNPFDGLSPFGESEEEANRGTIGFIQGFLGGVVVDEPRAALIGRDILSSGGSAADVAVAVSFALSVTKPSSASLGGGGICVVHDVENNVTETLDFLPREPSSISPSAIQPVAVPGTIRGLAVLHAKYGKLSWAQLVTPTEILARFGNRISRSFAFDLLRIPPAAMADPEFRKVFGRGKGGGIVREGDFHKQLDLSAVLGRLRARGAGDFYTGLMGRQFVAAVARAGGALDIKDLRSYKPVWRSTLKVPYFRNVTFHFPMIPGPSGVLAGQIMGMLIEDNKWDGYSLAERSHLLAEISGRAYSARGRWLRSNGSTAAPESLVSEEATERLIEGLQNDRHTPMPNARPGPAQTLGNNVGTSFVAVDREGSAVACALTLNNPFGVGRIARGMGIILAGLPAPLGRGLDSLGLMLGINNLHNIFYYGAAGTGSTAVPGVLAGVAISMALPASGESLETALEAKRVFNSGDPDVTYFEQGLAGGVFSKLEKMGHRLKPTSGMGLVNAIYCSTGVPNREGMSCTIRTDPRGFGLASGAE